MSSASTKLRTKEAFIVWAAEADGAVWRDICIAVSWFHRRQGHHPLPGELAYLVWLVESKRDWAKVHRAITSLRRKRSRHKADKKLP
jgi:hypothetical protein